MSASELMGGPADWTSGIPDEPQAVGTRSADAAPDRQADDSTAELKTQGIRWRRTVYGWEPMPSVEMKASAGGLPPITGVHPIVVMALQILVVLGGFALFDPTRRQSESSGLSLWSDELTQAFSSADRLR